MLKSWLIGKDSDAGRDWGQEEKGTTEDEMAGWHQRLDGRESGWTPGVGDGQGGLACCDSWVHKESDTTEQLIWFIEALFTMTETWPKCPLTNEYIKKILYVYEVEHNYAIKRRKSWHLQYRWTLRILCQVKCHIKKNKYHILLLKCGI